VNSFKSDLQVYGNYLVTYCAFKSLCWYLTVIYDIHLELFLQFIALIIIL